MFPKIGVVNPPKWMVYFMENPIKMDDLGIPLFLETPTSSTGCVSIVFFPHVLTSNKRPKSYWFEVREKGRHVLTLGLLAFAPKKKKSTTWKTSCC